MSNEGPESTEPQEIRARPTQPSLNAPARPAGQRSARPTGPTPASRSAAASPTSASSPPASSTSASSAPALSTFGSPAPAVPAAPSPVVDYSARPKPASRGFNPLFIQQTMIPPSLVLGVGFIAFATAYFLQPEGAALHRIDRQYAYLLLGLGCVSLVSAGWTMAAVRKRLKRTAGQ